MESVYNLPLSHDGAAFSEQTPTQVETEQLLRLLEGEIFLYPDGENNQVLEEGHAEEGALGSRPHVPGVASGFASSSSFQTDWNTRQYAHEDIYGLNRPLDYRSSWGVAHSSTASLPEHFGRMVEPLHPIWMPPPQIPPRDDSVYASAATTAWHAPESPITAHTRSSAAERGTGCAEIVGEIMVSLSHATWAHLEADYTHHHHATWPPSTSVESRARALRDKLQRQLGNLRLVNSLWRAAAEKRLAPALWSVYNLATFHRYPLTPDMLTFEVKVRRHACTVVISAVRPRSELNLLPYEDGNFKQVKELVYRLHDSDASLKLLESYTVDRTTRLCKNVETVELDGSRMRHTKRGQPSLSDTISKSISKQLNSIVAQQTSLHPAKSRPTSPLSNPKLRTIQLRNYTSAALQRFSLSLPSLLGIQTEVYTFAFRNLGPGEDVSDVYRNLMANWLRSNTAQQLTTTNRLKIIPAWKDTLQHRQRLTEQVCSEKHAAIDSVLGQLGRQTGSEASLGKYWSDRIEFCEDFMKNGRLSLESGSR